MPSLNPLRTVALAGTCMALLVALSACASSGSGGSSALSPGDSAGPSSSAASSPAPAVTVTQTVSATPTAPASHTYPSDYFAAILAAWKAHDQAYLALLTNDATATQIFGYGNINQTWHGTGSQGAMGSSYESFYNAAGDWIVLRVTNQELSAKQYHAGSVNQWDQMTFPTDAVTYAKHFIDALVNGNPARMTLLSSTTITAQFAGLAHKPDLNYTTSSQGAAGTTYVEIKETSIPFDVTIAVTNQTLGHQHAISACQMGC